MGYKLLGVELRWDNFGVGRGLLIDKDNKCSSFGQAVHVRLSSLKPERQGASALIYARAEKKKKKKRQHVAKTRVPNVCTAIHAFNALFGLQEGEKR